MYSLLPLCSFLLPNFDLILILCSWFIPADVESHLVSCMLTAFIWLIYLRLMSVLMFIETVFAEY